MSQALAGGCSGTRPFFLSFLVVAFAGLLTVACASTPPLANTSESPEALARAVLGAIETRDRARLDALALSQQEFEDHVWPALPAAKPERNLPVSYVWGDLHQKSDLALTQTLNAHGGRRYELLAVRFADVTPYAGYRVHREAVFRVRDAKGSETEIRVCGSMIETDDGWKVFSYVVD
jgi:hypothetical protein